jgi:hypothetical protein
MNEQFSRHNNCFMFKRHEVCRCTSREPSVALQQSIGHNAHKEINNVGCEITFEDVLYSVK